MKKITLLSFLLFLGLFTKAQINIDSLRAVWLDENQADTTRLNALHSLAGDGYLFSQPDSAYYFAQLQYDFAEKTGHKIHGAKALMGSDINSFFSGFCKPCFTCWRSEKC